MNYRRSYTLYKRGRYWYYRIYDGNGARVAKTTGQTSKGAARLFCDELLKTDSLFSRSMTFFKYASGFFDDNSVYVKANSLKKSTVLGYRGHLEKRIIPYFKNYKLKDITYSVLLAYRSELAEKYSANSVNSIMGAIKIICNSAAKDGLIHKNPFDGMHSIPVGIRADAFTEKELITFLGLVNDCNFRKFVMLIALTGLRIAEAVAVQESDYKVIDGIQCLHVTRQYYKAEYTTLKNGSPRIIPILPEFAGCTTKYKNSMLYVKLRYAFAQINKGRPIKLTVHSLRHFFITSAKSYGIQESKVEMIAGHSLKGISGVYTNFKATDLAEILKWQNYIVAMLHKTLADAREGHF